MHVRVDEATRRLCDVLERRQWFVLGVRRSQQTASAYVRAKVREDLPTVGFRVSDHEAKRKRWDVHLNIRCRGGIGSIMPQVIAWEVLARGVPVSSCPGLASAELLVGNQPATSAALVRGRAADDAGCGGGAAAERSSDKGRSDGAQRRHEAPRSEPRSRGEVLVIKGGEM